MSINIRRETSADYPVIHQVIKDAFETAEHTDHDEQNLVERLRKGNAYIPELTLVAEQDGKIVGHIMFTIVKVGEKTALALAPLAVTPGMQGKGVGGQLIRAGHRIAKEMGYEFSILLGHAGYYPRFGYLPASTFGIQCPFEVPDESFMAYNLQGTQTRLDGVVEYAKEFFDN